MTPDLIARYDRRIPRYTSYPTAPHFSGDVDGETYRRWLGEIEPDTAASLYLHIPFCQAMCWNCGCNTKVVRRLEPVASDASPVLLGFGASAIGRLPQGYVQNDSAIGGWQKAVTGGKFATRRGLALSDDDHIRRAIIERLMCDMAVDVDAVVLDHGGNPGEFISALDALSGMTRDGLVTIVGATLRMTPRCRPLVRAAAAAFDRYLEAPEDSAPRHASAI